MSVSITASMTLGSYRILSQIAQGGMGVVYLAEHVTTGEKAALKTLKAFKESQIRSMRREINAMRQLRHPGVVKVLEDGLIEGVPWYAMTYVEGNALSWYLRKLRKQLKQNQPSLLDLTLGASVDEGMFAPLQTSEHEPLATLRGMPSSDPNKIAISSNRSTAIRSWGLNDNVRKMLGWVGQVCRTLAYLHGEGLVHCDLKPDNILIEDEDDWPTLVDFGLVSSFGARVSQSLLETTGILAGTVQYISPEQIQGHQIDARSDLYAIGCILHEIVTGQVPFEEEDIAQHLRQHLVEAPGRPSDLNPEIPDALDDLIVALLAKEPHARPGHANVVVGVLEQLGIAVPPDNSGVVARPYLYKPTLVGRKPTLKRLAKHMRSAMRGKGRLVLLRGESGSGKTRIAQELIRRARNFKLPVLTGHCVPVNTGDGSSNLTSSPLHAFRSLFTNVADRCLQEGEEEFERLLGSDRAKVLAPYAACLRELPQLDYPATNDDHIAPKQGQSRLFTAVGQTMRAWSRDQPVLIVLDDLQWSDELSLECLRAMLDRHLTDNPWLILGLVRSDQSSSMLETIAEMDGAYTERMTRLSDDEVRAMVQTVLGLEDPPPALLKFVVQQAGGNPFHVSEYLRVAVEQAVIVRDEAGRWRLAVTEKELTNYVGHLAQPKSIQDLLAARLDGLNPKLRRLIEVAAVLGYQINPDVLTDASQHSPEVAQDAFEELVERDILTLSGHRNYRFTHDKLREVIYIRIERHRRAKLHQEIATILEQHREKGVDIAPGQLGYHLEKADKIPEAREAYLQEARFSAARFALNDAERYFRQAFALNDDSESSGFELIEFPSPQLINAHLDFIEKVLLVQSRHEEARYTLDRAIEGAEFHQLTSERARGLFILGRLQMHAGALDQALQNQKEAYAHFALLEDYNRMGETLGELALIYQRRGLYSKAISLYKEAIDILQNAGASRLEYRVQGNMALAYEEQGNYKEAMEVFERLANFYRGVGDRHSEAKMLNNIALIHQGRGEYEQALELSQKGILIFQQVGDRRSEAVALFNTANLNLLQSRYALARGFYNQSLTILETIGARRRQGLIWGQLATLEKELGHHEADTQASLQALIIFRETGDLRHEGQILAHMAHTHQQQQQYAEALRLYEQALDIQLNLGDRRSEGYTRTNIASLYRDRGQHRQARSQFELSVNIARDLGDRRLEAYVHLYRAQLYRYTRDRARASNNIKHAIQLFETLGETNGHLLSLCEQAHQALAANQDIDRETRTIQDLFVAMTATRESNVGQALEMLKRASKVREEGGELLFGQDRADLPTAIVLHSEQRKEGMPPPRSTGARSAKHSPRSSDSRITKPKHSS